MTVVLLHPTLAMAAGDSVVDQCAWCGALVCHHAFPTPGPRRQLGQCPACGCARWWRQRMPVGPFSQSDGGDAA